MASDSLRRPLAATLFCALAIAGASGARAEDAAGGKPLWELAVAGYGVYGPAYPGSAQNQFDFLPLPFPMYRGKFLRIGEDNEKPIRGRLFRSDKIKLDLDMDLNFGSDSQDIDARRGMPDLDPALQLGPSLKINLWGSEETLKFVNLALNEPVIWRFSSLKSARQPQSRLSFCE